MRENLLNIDESRIGERVFFRARIHGTRALSSKLAFLLLRDGLQIIQGVLGCLVREGDSGVDEQMVRWAEKLPLETLVLVEGRVQSPREDSGGEQAVVRSANVHGAEIEVYRILVLSQVTRRPPFNESQTSDSKGSKGTPGASAPRVGQALVLEHRALGLRTPHAHAIFRLVAAFSRAARSFLDARDFTEIHSAKLQQGASESGASVFHVDYFRRTATLAQSPQLAKEMCIGADFGRVYEIGPVFRAEHSNTHRHLCEFTGLDIEMAIDLDYHEAMDVIDGMLKHMFRTVQKQNRKELDAVKAQYPHDDLVFPEKTVVLTFVEGVRMLRESGYMDEGETEESVKENGGEMEDLSTRAEVRLGQLVKEKYNTDYYILDKFPSAVRPFYTMPDADDPKYSNAFDIFVRGEEILSGGQRLHSADALEASLEAHNVDPSTMKEYLEAFQFAMPPHAGGGIGLERLVMLFLKLGNIRNSTLIPRDPRSFPVDPNAPLKAIKLPVPSGIANFDEPNVLSKDPMYKQGIHPRLEDLIASFGDSTNTAWTDKEYEIWRHEPTGFAVGFVDAKQHAVTWGPPLCPPEALSEVVRAYVIWAKNERKLGVIWANADERTESALVREHNWRALAVTSEQRVMPAKVETMDNKHLEKKIRQAESAGVTVKIVEGPISEELRNELDEGMRAWMEGRTGAQIHTTNLRPWSDVQHRTYFVARNSEQKACGVIVLHQLSPEHGFQIKWSLMFPGAPNGTSELMVTTALRKMAEAGVKTATFGAGAKESFEAINGIGNIRGRILADVYKGISKTFGLTRKSHFREQFGTAEDSLFICYPPHGLGFSGINAIMESVKSH
ncbi:aspartyl-tRNA synthetase, cytoplasmic [Clavulina sp. PMI_390]|nr:aspartyl-tRNA synthetase, cytoplasmic [Clavulina sp. PMI_390]